MRAGFVVVAMAVVIGASAAPGNCQAQPATPAPAAAPTPAPPPAAPDVFDRFRIDLGAFRMSTQTVLTLNAPDANTHTDWENDLALPNSGTAVWADATWRLARRHQLNLNFTRFNRNGTETALKKDMPWGEYVYHLGANVTPTIEAAYAAGQYRFAAVRNERFELGPAVGVGLFRMKTDIVGVATKSGVSAGTIDTSSETKKTAFDIGVFFGAWLGRRVQLRGDFGYMRLSPDNSKVAVTDGRAALTWFPSRHIGVGAAYRYNKFRYDRDILVLKLGGSYRYQGVGGEVTFAFGGGASESTSSSQ